MFLSLTDSLITPKREGQQLGEFDADSFLLLVLVGLVRVEVESVLKQVVVIPPRTKDVKAKKGQLALFCTKIDEFWSEKMVLESLMERLKHEDRSNSWTEHLLQMLYCPDWRDI